MAEGEGRAKTDVQAFVFSSLTATRKDIACDVDRFSCRGQAAGTRRRREAAEEPQRGGRHDMHEPHASHGTSRNAGVAISTESRPSAS